MIPASSITAVLTADLSYNPSLHVQTVEIDRTGNNLLVEATTNFVRWYLSKSDFADMLRVVSGETDVSNQIFTMDASQGRLIVDASAVVAKLSNISKSFTIPLHNPEVQYGVNITDPSYIGYVGDISVNYERLLLAEDASSATTPSNTVTTWGFGSSSISMTINWEAADMSNVISVSANAGSTLTVTKPYNDAAADFIQIKMEGDAFDAHGRTTSSADITSASIDYASKFDSHTGGLIQFNADTPTLTISDLELTKALQQGINRDGITRDVSNTESLRTVVKEMIELRELVGFQSQTSIVGHFKTTIAGEYNSNTDTSFTLVPMIYFRYREPTRFALADDDPYGESNSVTANTYLYVMGIDSSGNVDNIDNVDDGTLTASIQLYDGTDISASSYEVLGVRHSLFENPDTIINPGYNDASYNTYVYKLNFPELTNYSPFYLYNDTGGNARINDLAQVTVNGISLKVGREKANITEIYPPSDISFAYIITLALAESININPIPAVTAEVAMATQLSTHGIFSFASGYDIRVTDDYTGSSTGVHKVCLFKTTGTTETFMAAGSTTIVADQAYRYTYVNDNTSTFDVWVDGVKQWSGVSNLSDLGSIDKIGTTYLDTASTRVSGTLQDFRTFSTTLTETQIETEDYPKPNVSWSMRSPLPEIGNVALASGASLATLNYIKSRRVPAKQPNIVSQSATPDTGLTVGSSSLTKSYTFDRPLRNYLIDASFASTDGAHTGNVSFSSVGKVGSIAFPINNASGYTVSNLRIRNPTTSVDIDDATYGFSIPNTQIWTPPTGVDSFTSQSSLPGSFMLVKDKSVTLRFTLAGSSSLHSSVNGTIVDRLQVTVGATTSALDPDAASTNMVVDAANRTLQFTYTATSTAQHDFLLYLKKPDGTRYTTTAYTASVSVTDVYAFPTMSSVTKDIDVVTLGETLTCTSQFDIGVSDVTGVASITPTGYGAITATNVSLSGTTYVYSFPVDYDVTYSGAITLTLGSSSITQSYSWATATTPFTLTGNHIYTFPSSFTHSGTLKEQEANTATLTFTGGDMLHSSVVATQIEYVRWNQGSDVTVGSGDLTCSDPLETITIANLTPTSGTTDLVFKVKLKAPDGTLSTEITHTVGSGNITELQPETSVSFKSSLLVGNQVTNWNTTALDQITPPMFNYNTATQVSTSFLNEKSNSRYLWVPGRSYADGIYYSTDAEFVTLGSGKYVRWVSGYQEYLPSIRLGPSTYSTESTLKTYQVLGMSTSDVYMMYTMVFQYKTWSTDPGTNSGCRVFRVPHTTDGSIFRLGDTWGLNLGSGIAVGFKVRLMNGSSTVVDPGNHAAGVIDMNKMMDDGWVVVTLQWKLGQSTVNNTAVSACVGLDYVDGAVTSDSTVSTNTSTSNYFNSVYGNNKISLGPDKNLGSAIGFPDFAGSTLYARSTEFTESEMKELNGALMTYYGISRSEGHYRVTY